MSFSAVPSKEGPIDQVIVSVKSVVRRVADETIYLDLSLIFLRFLFSLLILFFLHLALIYEGVKQLTPKELN